MLYSQNLQKQTRKFFQNGGGGARARRAGPGSAFSKYIKMQNELHRKIKINSKKTVTKIS